MKSGLPSCRYAMEIFREAPQGAKGVVATEAIESSPPTTAMADTLDTFEPDPGAIHEAEAAFHEEDSPAVKGNGVKPRFRLVGRR